ncbi:hypothetical protein EH240_34875 [Mesorhizobium tamadayense]|uniref:Propionyl-coenzyme A carboxylase alpha polypeptide n=1 Tax=Mesorhizobium tamadayense TaxID=425306 RepID=A0A3P3EQW3_9HYPH|nr:hypothetical protein EH240_34875 [Mesorhizobium tamadayense]
MANAAERPISPLAGEMSGRTEGGVKERQPSISASNGSHFGRCNFRLDERPEGQHPPLACRPSPPQGTRKGVFGCRFGFRQSPIKT